MNELILTGIRKEELVGEQSKKMVKFNKTVAAAIERFVDTDAAVSVKLIPTEDGKGISLLVIEPTDAFHTIEIYKPKLKKNSNFVCDKACYITHDGPINISVVFMGKEFTCIYSFLEYGMGFMGTFKEKDPVPYERKLVNFLASLMQKIEMRYSSVEETIESICEFFEVDLSDFEEFEIPRMIKYEKGQVQSLEVHKNGMTIAQNEAGHVSYTCCNGFRYVLDNQTQQVTISMDDVCVNGMADVQEMFEDAEKEVVNAIHELALFNKKLLEERDLYKGPKIHLTGGVPEVDVKLQEIESDALTQKLCEEKDSEN